MVKKSLLIMMLLALFAPWAAMAQNTITLTGNVTQTIEPNTTYNFYDSGGPDSNYGTNQNYTATLTADGDITINFSQFVTESSSNCSDWDHMHIYDGNASTGTLLARGQTGCSTATLTTGVDYVASSGTMTIVWKSDGSSVAAGWAATITGPVPVCCPKPKNLTCTATTGTPATATFTWTNGGEETQWQLEYGTASDFSGASTVTINQSDLVNGAYTLTGLTAEQTYYARIKAYCPSCNPNYSDWSNTIEFKPTNAIPQTVCNGTTTNGYVPVYGNYAENYNKDEFIIPATTEGMSNMTSGTIKGMTFYLSSPASDLWGAALYRVFMKEVNESSFASTSYYGTDGATIVYEGALDGTQSTMTIEFTRDYEYNGGNLLVGIYEYNKGSYKSCSFYGITSTNGSMYKNSSTSLESITSGTLQNFIPKTTFTYLPTNTPKPRNIQVSDTPTGYEYQIKVSGEEWPTSWINAENNLSVEHTGLTASTDYVVRVRATYAEGNSKPVETQFTTLDNCAFPTGFAATLTPGVGTMATFSWTKGFSEDDDWVLQYGTDNTFATCTEINDGFTVSGNTVTFEATTDITPEVLHYARVKTDCGSGSYSSWTDVYEFTPSNYVDYTFRETASSTISYVPFYGSYTTSATNQSQFVIPASELVDLTGGTIRSITYYTSSTATTDWGGVEFDVYMTEVQDNTFSSATFIDWATLGSPVYSGTVSLSNQKMIITFDNNYAYNGGNLLIGFKNKKAGTSTTSMSWTAYYGSTYYEVHQYGTNSANRSYYQPKITFSYQPTPYKKPVIDEASCTFETTSAHIAWTVTGATPTGYQYQYKPASATEWPSAWTSVTTAAADLSGLTPGSSYDFRVKALYDGGNESFAVDYSFFTECTAVTAFPWKEDFEAYSTGDFSHPCWVNEHISGDGSSIFKVYTTTTGSNTTHKLQLPDQTEGTLTKLRLPEMNLPSNNYQFVIDVYRSTAYEDKTGEGVRVYASTNGEIDGATELAFIPRLYSVASGIIPAEATGNAWYTYELPIGMSGTCYIILRGENQYGTSTYMDNLTVEQISTCARPSELASSNVTNHSATIEWTAGDAEQTLWQIAYSKTNFDPNTANFDVTTVTTIDATAHPFTLDKILDAASTYYVYVRANCGTATEPDFGPWSRKGISFTTQVATPAPSNFVASNPASAKVDLVWNAGGGDFESWELYYVASDDAPEAPTASTTATVSNITTLPTTENPYVLDELTATTKYYAWVRAKHVWNNETTYSDWVALTGYYFETLDACPTPTNLVATNLTSVSADLSWVGSDDVDSYTVQYRTAAGVTSVFTETFDNTAFPTDWARYNTLLTDEVLSGSTTLTANSSGWYNSSYGLGEYNWKVNLWNTSVKYWMVTPSIAVETGNVLTFDAALTAYNNNNAPDAAKMPNEYSKFVVLISDDNMATWSILREWNNSGSSYVLNNISNTGTSATIDLSTFANKNVKIAFYCEQTVSGPDCDLHIDNVTVGTPTTTGDWIDATTNVEEQSFQLTGLTNGTKYDVRVKSNCTNGEYCEPVSFTTLAEGNMVFTNATNDGKWGNSGNWAPDRMPVLTDEVILRANATIESGCVAEADKITFEGTPTPTLTIADGGQLITNTAVNAKVQKVINAHGATVEEGGWNFIALPINSSLNPNYADLITDTYGATIPTGQSATYDLYKFNQNPTIVEGIGNEWMNYRKAAFNLVNGNGYLYANAATVTLNFTGNIRAYTQEGAGFGLNYYEENPDANMHGWNLMGNPYTFNAYVNKSYYKMNENGSAIEPVDAYQTTTIAPCTGIMVQATETGQSITFSKDAPSAQNGKGNLSVALAQANVRNNAVMDKAVLSFNEGSQLGKFYFGENAANIYFPQDNKEFAIVSSEGQGEMPLNFRANENGTYTLSFNAEEVSFSYLHLIDNMTGMDVDLLQAPSYTFNATTTDYSSRFKLVFATGVNNDSDNFAFLSNGNWIIGNEGEATLQVVDVTGRILSSETVNGSVSKAINAAPGVYMLRLINGENVKVQKIVVR